jgi:diacylglycerol kinase (ATP)
LAKTSNNRTDTGGTLPLVIVNPRSAGGATGENWAAIASDLRTHFGPFKVEFTKGPGDGAAIAKENAEAGVSFIIACGGDGTIHEVANGILESGKDVELGILPSGTGGDFRRSLEIPDDPREAAKALRTGKTKNIDVGRITFQNFKDETETSFFHHRARQIFLIARLGTDRRRSRYGKLCSVDDPGSCRA